MLPAARLLASGFVLLAYYTWVRALAADVSGAWRGTDGTVVAMLALVGRRYRFAGHCWLAWPGGHAEGTVRGRCDYLGRLRLEVEIPDERVLRFRGRVTAARRIVGRFAGPDGNPTLLRFRGVGRKELARATRDWPQSGQWLDAPR